ncbi:DUF5007 domain-containing protein [Pedobacter nyackensis]|uniref:DUF5007 domain-containing protein n=1 Tax=Pedobacter nyackensis TaxID=475255 RepID=A0A1W2AH12_9SPHI|nr:DUF5007 domain-containing protein [Pedobacter nyackensis]SMC59985.1 protein of unknown function [Pedobacter nyackensis]
MRRIYLSFCLLFVTGMALLTGCKKQEKIGFISPTIAYTTKTLTVVTGRGLIMSAALATDGSTKPIEASIVSIHDENGKVFTELMNYKVDTYYWTGTPTGLETSLDQINKIRIAAKKPAIDINPTNGQIIIYPEAKDPAIFPSGRYIFDIKVKNSGGEMIIKNALTINTTPAGPYSYAFSGVDGITGIDVTMEKTVASTGPTKLIVRTLRKDDTPIDPKTLLGYEYGTVANPNLKDWHNLGLQKIVKYTEFPDRLEIETEGTPIPVIGGLPTGQGIPIWAQRIDMYNNNSAIGKYFNYWFDFAIFEPGTWNITIKLKY